MANIYVASSWRNAFQPQVVAFLRKQGHDVYDFKNSPNEMAVKWDVIDPNYKNWNLKDYQSALRNSKVQDAYHRAQSALLEADYGVLVLPAGRSANSEAGWLKGAGKNVLIYSPLRQDPELMYLLYDRITDNLPALNRYIQHFENMKMFLVNARQEELVGIAESRSSDRAHFTNKIAVKPGEYPLYKR